MIRFSGSICKFKFFIQVGQKSDTAFNKLNKNMRVKNIARRLLFIILLKSEPQKSFAFNKLKKKKCV